MSFGSLICKIPGVAIEVRELPVPYLLIFIFLVTVRKASEMDPVHQVMLMLRTEMGSLGWELGKRTEVERQWVDFS